MDVPPQGFDFPPQRLVLGHLAIQEPRGRARLLGNSPAGEKVHVGLLVVAVLEIGCLDEALLHEGPQAEVHSAQAHAELARELALADLGVLLQQAQYLGAVLVGQQTRSLFND